MTTNQDFKNAALEALKGKWAPALIATIVFYLIIIAIYGGLVVIPPTSGAVTYFAGGSLLFVLLIVLPLVVGYYNSLKTLYVTGDDRITRSMLRIGFSNYLHKIWGMLLMLIFIMLWTLLLYIPGIIMTFAYALTPYILEDEPELSAFQAIKKSRAMMKGHKFDLFWLELSFIGWGILSIFTLGIGLLWLIPYMYTSVAAFYENLKETAEIKAAE